MKMLDAIKKVFTRPKPEFIYVEGHLEFSQDKDCCDPATKDDMQTIRATIENGGGGYYWTIKTDRWALDPDDKRVERCLTKVLKNVNRTYDFS